MDKLDVIDFPGVDDVSTVPEVTKLLVNLAQVVIFVVDYKYVYIKLKSLYVMMSNVGGVVNVCGAKRTTYLHRIP